MKRESYTYPYVAEKRKALMCQNGTMHDMITPRNFPTSTGAKLTNFIDFFCES